MTGRIRNGYRDRTWKNRHDDVALKVLVHKAGHLTGWDTSVVGV
jgi:hypothetical protein